MAVRERVRKKLKMPDVTGLAQRDALIALDNAGFVVRPRIRYVESYEALGTVVAQDPIRGNLIDNLTTVEIRVAKRSYLRYLPQIYQTDAATGNDFLKEFLWVFQHLTDSVTQRLDNGHRYYDPRETPSEFLPWLASWVALTVDVDWPDIKKRQLIRSAAELYKFRGTKRALRDVIRIFLEREPRIEENKWPYPGFRVGVTSTVGIDTIVLPVIDLDHCFIVHIPARADEITEEMVVKIHNLISLEKPAHTTYFLQFQTEDKVATPQVFMQIGVSAMGVPDLRFVEEATSDEVKNEVVPAAAAAADIPVRNEPDPARRRKRGAASASDSESEEKS